MVYWRGLDGFGTELIKIELIVLLFFPTAKFVRGK